MTPQTLAIILIVGVVALVLGVLWGRRPAPAVVQRAEDKLEAFADAELVKVAKAITARLNDTSSYQQTILEAQAAMAHRQQIAATVRNVFSAAPPQV